VKAHAETAIEHRTAILAAYAPGDAEQAGAEEEEACKGANDVKKALWHCQLTQRRKDAKSVIQVVYNPRYPVTDELGAKVDQ